MNYSFTKDFTTRNVETWTLLLGKFAGCPDVHGIEIGCFEGRSSIWLLENILQHETSHLTCIDPWCAPASTENIRPFRHKVRLMKGRSHLALRDPVFKMNSIQFVYIDGNHMAPSVLEDAVLSLPLLAPGGILIFDDYPWKSSSPDVPQTMPKMAIDAFLSVYEQRLKLLHKGWQVCLEKL
jgi:predicted O-methyltransferase YrrM